MKNEIRRCNKKMRISGIKVQAINGNTYELYPVNINYKNKL